jgi:hypothetical protein
MIEQAVVVYLNSDAAVLSAFGGTGKVYPHRAPASIKMPWCVVTNSGGSRKRESLYVMEPRDTLTLYVESMDYVGGLNLANTILHALENYRGDMPPERDIHITCGTIRDLDGFQGSYRFVVPVYVRYRQIAVFPNAGTV